ncbi:murein L,D-transpeptidase [Cellulosimicrobium arenosum]|uniref:Murein L,D-transpeptidase n=2 Tax=Cellulosimicrobium arenosum TaxID=2708133 RepID=A0A927J286_9MICO|nr:murein L,D-transpeptidase [Cellulosimicrobium arenosum]
MPGHDARRGTRRVVVPVLVALLALAGCQAGLPDMEPGRAPTATTTEPASADASPTSTEAPAPEPSTTAPTEEPSEEPSDEPSEEPAEDLTDTATETPTEEPEPEPEATETPAEKPAEPEKPAALVRGASGERVTALQARLHELGYFIGSPDGSFGPGTQQAVWALQKAAGISRDGVVGPATQAALDDGVRPGAQSSSGKVIEIDLGRQLLLAVEDGKVVTVINASGGSGEAFEAKGRQYHANTPRGTFQVGRQVDADYESSLELGSMWRPKFFTGGIAVHGSPSIPPWGASHGCVRVANGAMNWIWDSWGAPPGTTVLVY